MTTYAAITAAQVDADSYIDTNLAGQWTNNLLAIAEQDPSASAVWVKGSWIELGDSGVISGAAQVDFEGLDSTYDVFMVVHENVVPVTDAVHYRGRVGTGGTPTYQTGTVYDNNTLAYMPMSNPATDVGSAAGESLSGIGFFYNLSDSSFRTKYTSHSSHTSSAGVASGLAEQGDYTAVTAVTALRFYFSSGNIESGRIKLYGLRK